MKWNLRLLRTVEDADTLQQAEDLKSAIAEGDIHFNMAWLAEKGFVAVPIDNPGFFDEAQSRRLAEAAEALGVTECLAVAIEEWGDIFPRALHVPTTAAALDELSRELAACPYLLVATREAFAVLCSSSYFNVVAGPPAFVEAAVEGGIEGTRRWFRQFAEDWETPDEVGLFLKIAERYEATGDRG